MNFEALYKRCDFDQSVVGLNGDRSQDQRIERNCLLKKAF